MIQYLKNQNFIFNNKEVKQSKLLAIFPDFGPSTVGGVQLSARLAWEGLDSQSNCLSGNVHLFCYGQPSESLTSLDQITYVSSKAEGIWAALHRHWRAETVLIWHVGLLKLLPFFRLRGVRTVLFLHGIEIWRPQDRLTTYLLHQIDLFISNSDYTWQRFLTYHPSLSTIAHSTVALGVGKPATATRQSPNEIPAMLMISRLVVGEDYKGHRELIGVWRHVITKLPTAQLWIVGDGDLRAALEQLVHTQNLEKNIHFWGYVSEQKKTELISKCRCLALPSHNEGFGLVYLEAMRLGRPCLVSTLDAGREVIQPPVAGLAVDPSDSYALTDAVIQLLSSGTTWDAWSQQARQRYEEYFTADHFQKRLIDALFHQ